MCLQEWLVFIWGRLGQGTNKMKISWTQFGPLYHGTSVPGLSELQQRGARYTAMRNSFGWNYATTDLELAKQYAMDATRMDVQEAHRRFRRGEGPSPESFVPIVYRVRPAYSTFTHEGKRHTSAWGPDPDSGPGGWHDGPRNRREALDIVEGGGPVSLRFAAPLRAEEVWRHPDWPGE